MTDPTPDVKRPAANPMAFLALVLAASAAILLLGGILFAFADSGQGSVDATGRFRLLGQAANPFVAFTAVASLVVVAAGRERSDWTQRAERAVVTVGTTVCVMVTLLAVNGILTDLTGRAPASFQLSAVVSRLGTLALSGFGLWLSGVRPPPSSR